MYRCSGMRFYNISDTEHIAILTKNVSSITSNIPPNLRILKMRRIRLILKIRTNVELEEVNHPGIIHARSTKL